ncbi:hypothetical protein AB4Y32_10590 [Paraburkholderia phymatum]|uniref:Uncharacterized protein n=1 Tax=Paraburkholderia phymatum TaxID=148447 RepID=A0ACC6TYD2_9BURK
MNRYYSVQRFSDAQEHAQSFVNFDLSYFQTGKGPFEGTVQQLDLGDGFHIFAESTNRQLAQRGQVRPGSISVAWGTFAPTRRREEICTPLVGVLHGGDDWILHRPSGAEVGGITMSAAEFDQLSGAPGVGKTPNKNRHIQFLRDGNVFSGLRSDVNAMSRHAERFSCADARTMIRKQLLDGVFCALSASETTRSPGVTRMT